MKLPTPEVSRNVSRWVRAMTGGNCTLDHFKSKGAIFKCRVCKETLTQAADSLSNGVPIKLQDWAEVHAHGAEIETEIEMPKPKKKKAKVAKPKPPVIQMLTQHKGRKFRD